MRLLIAGIAALAAVSFAAPSFAQEATDAAPVATPTPTPVVKHKPGTSAYCNSLKSSSQRSSCLKRVQTAKVTKPTHPTTKTKKPARAPAATSADSLAPTPAPAPAQMSAPSNGSSVAVPPLPQKTI
jgi:outer membrane biosynthesis protein TonB